ncbi:hypothetical protein AAC387_Pa03g4617 [Persea americana]
MFERLGCKETESNGRKCQSKLWQNAKTRLSRHFEEWFLPPPSWYKGAMQGEGTKYSAEQLSKRAASRFSMPYQARAHARWPMGSTTNVSSNQSVRIESYAG